MLIGLHGKARSGKDSIYEFIKEDFEGPGVKIVRDAFADRLKLSAYRNFKPDATVEEAVAWAEYLKESDSWVMFGKGPGTPDPSFVYDGNVTGRQFLQHYGTEAHREVFGQDFWISAVLPDPWEDNYGRDDVTSHDLLVVTDVRFPNEAERILDCGGSVWHVKRKGQDDSDAHASEQPLSPEYITLTIENNSTLDALRAKVHAFVWGELSQQVMR